jgi:hypothetical protein
MRDCVDRNYGNGWAVEKEPLICADFVSLICADLGTEDCVNQRFLLHR